MLPSNFLPGASDPLPPGIFLVPLCTDAEGVREMTYALDTAYKMTANIKVIKDFINALQYINNPQDAICWSDDPPPEPAITVETDRDCQRILIDGIPVTDWICPPDPENPPDPQEPTGRLGLTLREMEDLVMGCLNLDGSLRWKNGVLEMRTCDGWAQVPGLLTTLSSGAQALQQGMMNFDEWIEAGEPPLPTSPPLPHDDPLYTTFDVLKCAKATAMVEEIWNVLTIGDAVRTANTISQVVSVVTSLFGFAGDEMGYALAQAIWLAATGSSFGQYADEMEDVFNDTAGKQDLICALVDKMKSPVKILNWTMATLTADDVKAAIETFEEILDPPDSVKKTVRAFPVSGWLEVVTPKVRETECGCEDYIPAGYTPPVDGFAVQFLQFSAVHGGSITTPYAPSPTTQFSVATANPRGVRVGEDYQATYLGVDANRHWTGLGLLFKPTEPITIESVKVWYEATVGHNLTARMYAWNGTEWLAFRTDISVNGESGGEPHSFTFTHPSEPNLPNITHIHIAIRFQSSSEGANVPNATVNKVEFTGAASDGSPASFELLDDNEVLP